MAKIHLVYQKSTQAMIAFQTETLAKDAMRAQDGEYLAYLLDVGSDRETMCKFFNRDIGGIPQDKVVSYESRNGRLIEMK